MAEVAPPLVGGKQVQATQVAIHGHYAYVSYGMAGPTYAGASYIIDIQNPSQPVLKAEMTQSAMDFYSVASDGERLYLAGASADESGGDPARLEVIELAEQGARMAGLLKEVPLPSFAATDLALGAKALYVTSGDREGGITRMDPVSLKPTGFAPLEDSRALAFDGTQLAVFKGTPGHLYTFDPELRPLKNYPLPASGSIPASQASVNLSKGQAYLGTGDGGLLAISLEKGQVVDQLKAVSGITNGASVAENYAFSAEGEDGVSVARVNATGQFERLGSFRFGDKASSNMVKFHNNLLFVANGHGGLSLLNLEAEPAPTPTPTPTPSSSEGLAVLNVRELGANFNFNQSTPVIHSQCTGISYQSCSWCHNSQDWRVPKLQQGINAQPKTAVRPFSTGLFFNSQRETEVLDQLDQHVLATARQLIASGQSQCVYLPQNAMGTPQRNGANCNTGSNGQIQCSGSLNQTLSLANCPQIAIYAESMNVNHPLNGSTLHVSTANTLNINQGVSGVWSSRGDLNLSLSQQSQANGIFVGNRANNLNLNGQSQLKGLFTSLQNGSLNLNLNDQGRLEGAVLSNASLNMSSSGQAQLVLSPENINRWHPVLAALKPVYCQPPAL
ncbi:MAG: hypothetical protein ACO1RX_09210 [Candidatus Sericytochromatia bacterium]